MRTIWKQNLKRMEASTKFPQQKTPKDFRFIWVLYKKRLSEKEIKQWNWTLAKTEWRKPSFGKKSKTKNKNRTELDTILSRILQLPHKSLFSRNLFTAGACINGVGTVLSDKEKNKT